MTLLDSHLEQIALSSKAIAELPFPPPTIFTNALLNAHDITALIRDTEPHERALFTLDPQAKIGRNMVAGQPRTGFDGDFQNVHSIGIPRHGSAAAAKLGKDLGEKIRGEALRARGNIDIEALIKGAERLCAIYPIAGAKARIASQRSRLGQLTSSIDRYESRVSTQAGQLAKLNKVKRYTGDSEEHELQVQNNVDSLGNEKACPPPEEEITMEDLEREEEEIRELENRKSMLEDRVTGMERDLGGLLR